MQTTEEEERSRHVRQILRGGARIQVQSLVSSIIPCYKRFLDMRARRCRITSLVSCIGGGLQTSHDGALPLKMVGYVVIHKGIVRITVVWSAAKTETESEKGALAQRYLENRIKS